MSNLNNVLILIGSPKAQSSASNNFASYLEDKFKMNGVEADKMYIVRHQKPEKMEELVKKASETELMVLINPLYIDSIPAITINFMEQFCLYQKSQKDSENAKKQKLLAIFNSGFPEPHHNNVAVGMCENFAQQTNMEWIGGITIGMGAAFESRQLKDAGGMSRNLRKGIDLIVDSLSQNDDIPHDAVGIASKPLMPLFLARWGMRFLGGRMWKGQVKDKSVIDKMYDRPYEI